METLKVDKTKLVRVNTFAKRQNLTVQQVYNWIKDGKVKSVKIDGMTFIEL